MKKLFLTTLTLFSGIIHLTAGPSMPFLFLKSSLPGSDSASVSYSLPAWYSDTATVAVTAVPDINGSTIDSLDISPRNTTIDDENPNKPDEEKIKLEDFRVYPNPTSGFINVFLPGKELLEYELRIIDPSGKEVIHKKNIYSSFPFRFNTENLEKGVYLIHIIYKDESVSRKIIVN